MLWLEGVDGREFYMHTYCWEFVESQIMEIDQLP